MAPHNIKGKTNNICLTKTWS